MTREDEGRRFAAETAGIDEAMIERLVHGFYAAIRQDSVLGPIFLSRITDWDRHLARMCAFWSSVMLVSGRYAGRPMEAHARLPIDGRHFDRWLALFEESAHRLCPPAAAGLFLSRARRIAQSLELGVAIHSGVVLGRGERLSRPELDWPAERAA